MIIEYCQRHPFLRLLVPLVVGILCGDAFPFPHSDWSWAFPLFFLPLVVAGMKVRNCRWLYGAGVCLFFFGVGYTLVGKQLERVEYVFPVEASTYEIRIYERPEVKKRSILCRAVLVKEGRKDTVVACPGEKLFLLYFPKDSIAAGLRQGMRVWVHTRLSPPVNNGNPDEFDYVRYLKHKGVAGMGYVASGHWRVTGRETCLTFRQVALGGA